MTVTTPPRASGDVGQDERARQPTEGHGASASRPKPLARLATAVGVVVLLLALLAADGVAVGAPAVAQEVTSQRVIVVALAASVEAVLNNIRNWVVGILALLATVFLTIGGARYVWAGGDPGEVERARAALRSAAFGYVLALLAPLVVEVLKGIVGA